MVERKHEGALTENEKKIVKALLNDGWRNQDIQELINIEREATVNSARITEVKQDNTITPASDDDVDFFKAKKQSYDLKTGLNVFDDERLIRSREAMSIAVQIFNSPIIMFKTETFSVLAIIAWTYLMHEYYSKRGIPITDSQGKTFSLRYMLRRDDCPLSEGIKNNLTDIMDIRNAVEHKLFRRSDKKWLSLFQACCLNFDKKLSEFFGEKVSLRDELGFALQFSKMDMDQLSALQKFEVPKDIEALDARLQENHSEEELLDLEYRFRVVYTIDASSKGQAHIQFVTPDSDEGKEIKNVLLKYKPADEMYPYKPTDVARLVKEISGKAFSTHNHTQSWKKFKVRPPS